MPLSAARPCHALDSRATIRRATATIMGARFVWLTPMSVQPVRTIAHEQVLACLLRIRLSPEFEKAARLQAFLEFVVKEHLAGRGKESRKS